MEGHIPRIPDLTPDNRIWRLDWFGDTAYLPGTWRSAQPRLKVVLSPLLCVPDDNDALLRPDCTDQRSTYETRISVAALPLLGIGDLWQNGRRLSSPTYTTELFTKLQISDQTVNIIKAGLSLEDKFLLPLQFHPWHRQHTQAYCVEVSAPNGIRLIIPCMELIRFYFGSTGNFVQRLFTGPLEPERLWEKKYFSSRNKHLHMGLAENLSGASAADIGRIATSRTAWRSAARIYVSCQKASARKDFIYPYTTFPFSGRTEFAASGIWLPFGDEPDKTFLAYKIQSCSHAFPFQSLSYITSDRKKRRTQYSNHESKQSQVEGQKKQEAAVAVDTDPSSKKAQKQKKFQIDDRFPDLVKKRVWRKKLETSSATYIPRNDASHSVRQNAFGEPDGTSNATAVDASLSSKTTATPPIPKFVQRAIDAILSNTDFASDGSNTNLVTPKDCAGFVFNVPQTTYELGDPDNYITSEPPQVITYNRRACFIELISPVSWSTHTPTTYRRQLLIVEKWGNASRPYIAETTRRTLRGAQHVVSSLYTYDISDRVYGA